MQCTDDSVDAQPFLDDELDARPRASGEPSHGGVMQSATPKDSFVYRMDFPRRGQALIINNRDFEPKTGMTKRNGTDTDAANLYQRCKALGFETSLKQNLSTTQMLKLLVEVSQQDHSNAACFMCCILSHGEEGKVYGTDGKINVDLLTQGFKGDKCRSLAGKPKIFIIQACRGSQLDHGVEMTDAFPERMDFSTDVYRIPSEADFLMAYSVVPGYFSWRNSTKGSWFIQAFCAVMQEYGEKEEVMKLMTRVNRKVAYDFESNAAKEFMNEKKQIPCIVSMLTKQLYFSP